MKWVEQFSIAQINSKVIKNIFLFHTQTFMQRI